MTSHPNCVRIVQGLCDAAKTRKFTSDNGRFRKGFWCNVLHFEQMYALGCSKAFVVEMIANMHDFLKFGPLLTHPTMHQNADSTPLVKPPGVVALMFCLWMRHAKTATRVSWIFAQCIICQAVLRDGS